MLGVNEYLYNSTGSITEVKTALAHSLQLLWDRSVTLGYPDLTPSNT